MQKNVALLFKRLDFSNTAEYESQGGSTKRFRIPKKHLKETDWLFYVLI